MAANDPTRLTRSDLLPVLSSRGFLRSLPFSRTFWALVALGGVEIYLFRAAQNPFAQVGSLTLIIVIAVMFLAIFLAGMIAFVRAKAALAHVAFGVIVATLLWQTPLVMTWIGLWRAPNLDPAALFQPAPPQAAPAGQGQQQVARPARPRPAVGEFFVSMYFGAGVAEDTFKLVPVAVFLLLAVLMRRAPRAARLVRYIEPHRPTSILMVALGSAATFVFFETVYQYVPNNIAELAANIEAGVRQELGCLSPAALQGRTQAEIARNQNCLQVAHDFAVTAGYMNGILLLMARLIGFISGHGAYAAIAAYGLVLAVNKTRGWSRLPAAIAMIVGAVAVSATLHALWNTIGFATGGNSWAQLAICLLSFVILLAVAAKARALDRELGYTATRQLGDSLLLTPVVPVFAGGGVPAAAAPRMPVSAPLMPVSAPRAPTAAPQRAPAAVSSIATLTVEGTRIAILPDATIDLAAQVPRASGVSFEVASRPGDANTFGLRNRSNRAWQIRTSSGRTAEIAPGRVAALSDGLAIDFGPVSGTVSTS